MWTVILLAFAVAISLALPSAALAGVVSVPVPGVAGPYELGETRIANFDLGAQFTSIRGVILRFTVEDISGGRGPEDMVGFSLRNPVASGVPQPVSSDGYYIWMSLLDDDAGELDGDALPLDLDLSAFETARLDIQAHMYAVCLGWSCFSHGFTIQSTIESFEVVAEPSTSLLVTICLAALGGVMARRR